MTDPIKAALEVATMLPCREANDRCLCHEAGALDMDTCGNEFPDVAAAIAAFLRALPLMDGVDPEGKSFPIDLTGIAVAVERVAGGGV